MKAFKRREVTDLQHLRSLVADNADAMESDLKILASNLNLGRTTVELAALDGSNVPVIFVLGLTADDAMLVRALEAYAWCLEYPESLQRLVPADVQHGLDRKRHAGAQTRTGIRRSMVRDVRVLPHLPANSVTAILADQAEPLADRVLLDRVSDGVQVGAQSGIRENAPAGAVLFGTPAQPLNETLRQTLLLRRLPDLFKDVKKLKEAAKPS